MNKLLEKITDVTSRGYEIQFSYFLHQHYISIYKDSNLGITRQKPKVTTVLPEDHMTEDHVIAAIDHNIESLHK